MRWPWSSGPRDGGSGGPPLDTLDPETLEVVELDADGRRVSPPPVHAPDRLAELPYATHRDPGSLAGLWEAIEHP